MHFPFSKKSRPHENRSTLGAALRQNLSVRYLVLWLVFIAIVFRIGLWYWQTLGIVACFHKKPINFDFSRNFC